ncbi:MAG: hypothetical protein IIA00_03955 [Proteobacteria bacterium]|nr:hypothetical protein [Pseudomonadota bacterium]
MATALLFARLRAAGGGISNQSKKIAMVRIFLFILRRRVPIFGTWWQPAHMPMRSPA